MGVDVSTVKSNAENRWQTSPSGLTLTDIGKKIGVTRECARQHVEKFKRLLRCNEKICDMKGVPPEKLHRLERCSGCEHLYNCIMEVVPEILAKEAARGR